MKFLIRFYFILIITLFNQNSIAFNNKILFVIDEEIITSIDIYNHSKYLVALDSGLKNLNDDDIFEISKNLILKKSIKKLALERENILIDIQDEELNSYINLVYSSKDIKNLDDLKKFANSLEIEYETIKQNLIIEILWNRLIFQKFSSKLRINQENLRNSIEEQNKKKIPSYLLNEIVFETSKKSDIGKIYNIIKSDINKFGFDKAALTHSISASASNGGKIGWLKESSLDSKIINALSNMKINDISKPLKVPGGFLIIMMEDKKFIKENINIEEELKNLVRLKTNEQLSQYSNIYLNKVKKEIKINGL